MLLALLAAEVATMAAPTSAPPVLTAVWAPIVVEVGNVRNDRGVVRVSICPQERWLADSCPWEGFAPAHAGTTRVVIDHGPPGNYGAQVFHDENTNNEVDRGIFGIPKEGVGFSRDSFTGLASPKWRNAVFAHTAQPQTIRLQLRYMLGSTGPQAGARPHSQAPTP